MADSRKRIFENRGKPVTESNVIYFERKRLRSEAYLALTGLGHLYVLHFLGCRQGHMVKASGLWEQSNNGKIYFTYADAKKYYGVKYPGRHNRTLKQLHMVGFIDIAHHGGGMDGDCTLFSISKRWEKFGMPEFEFKEWPKDTRKHGNMKIKEFGKGR